jgi:hypothetical protein
MFFAVVGFFQTQVVKWWIGVNEGPLVPKTYSITMPFSSLRGFLLTELNQSFTLRTKQDEQNLLVVTTLGTYRVVMASGPDRTDSSRSILCMIPLEHGPYEISTTEEDELKNLVNDIVFNLQGRLIHRAEANETNNDPVLTATARSVAIQPTVSKYSITKEKWNKIPTEFKTAFAITVAAWILTTVLFFEQTRVNISLEFGIYWEITVLVIIAIVAELGIPLAQDLRETRSRKTRIPVSP